MRIAFYIIILWLSFFLYSNIFKTVKYNLNDSVLYPNIFYDITGSTIKVITNLADYNNQSLEANTIYFLWNKKLKDDYDWKKMSNLNVKDYNNLVKFRYKYIENKQIFIK